MVRKKYSCDCLAFYSSGWVCSHVVTCLSMFDNFNIDVRLRKLPVRKPTGRPRKLPSALVKESRDRYFSEVQLLRMMEKKPLSIAGYKCKKRFVVSEDGGSTKTTVSVVGQIYGFVESSKTWMARFSIFDIIENVKFRGFKTLLMLETKHSKC